MSQLSPQSPSQKPPVKLIGEDGNVFNVIGRVTGRSRAPASGRKRRSSRRKPSPPTRTTRSSGWR